MNTKFVTTLRVLILCLMAVLTTAVVVLTTTYSHQQPAPKPVNKPSLNSTMMNSQLEWKGLIEAFKVTKFESPLPGLRSGTILPGEHFPDLGQKHVEVGTRITYNSNPPTSGSHYPFPAPWGIYKQAPVDEFLVHNLEHGGIVISYNPNRIKGQELEKLKTQARSLSKFNGRIIVAPRPNLDTPMALTAWNYLKKLDRYDPKMVKLFYDTHIARGPECFEGLCPL